MVPIGRLSMSEILFEPSKRPRSPPPLRDRAKLPVRLQTRAERLVKYLRDAIPIDRMRIAHERGLAWLVPPEPRRSGGAGRTVLQMRGREEEVKMQRSISTEDDGIAAIILKTAEFGVNLRKCRLSKVAAASPRPRQDSVEIIARSLQSISMVTARNPALVTLRAGRAAS